MDPSQANTREYLPQAIDAEIKSLEGSIRVLKLRRNALAPVFSLPTEVITAIFSFLRVPRGSPPFTLGEKPDHLAWLRVAHICHQWREIALNQPLFWSYVDFTTFSPAGVAEILARAKTVPLHSQARIPIGHWDHARSIAFQEELQGHVSHIYHLSISAEPLRLHRTLKGLVSPAPTLEYLSLSSPDDWQNREIGVRPLVPDTLFDGSTPRLSCLARWNCDISWKSPLLRGLKHLMLEMRTPFEGRASQFGWMLWMKCHNSRRLPFMGPPRLHLLVPYSYLTLSAPSHSPPLRSSRSSPLRGVVGSHSLISSYRLSPRCASLQHLIAGTAATCKKSSRILLDTPTDPRMPNRYRACQSAAILYAPISLCGPCPISTSSCPVTLHAWRSPSGTITGLLGPI